MKGGEREGADHAEHVVVCAHRVVVQWKYIDDGTGGDILLDRNPEKIVKIRIANKYSNNIKAICAILAHEVCHKLLFENGLYWPNFTELTETSTDLCTLYVGLGKLVLDGYVAAGSKETQILGYLELSIYKRTYNLVEAVLWHKNVDVEYDNSEPYLQEAHRLWHSSENKKKIIIDAYKTAFEKYGQLCRRNEIIEQMLMQYVDYLQESKLQEEHNLFNEKWYDQNGIVRPFAAFTGLYKSLVLKEQINSEKHIDEIIHYQNYLLYILRWSLPQKIVAHSAAEKVYCPKCKSKIPGLKLLGRKTIVKCPKCGNRLFVNGEILDLTEAKDDYLSFRNSILKEAEEVLAKDNSSQIKKAFSDGERSMESKCLTTINDYQKQRQAAIKRADKTEIELRELKNKIDKLPKWIKFILGKRLE